MLSLLLDQNMVQYILVFDEINIFQCVNFEFLRDEVLRLWLQNMPVTLDIILTCGCPEGEYSVGPEVGDNCLLLESWTFSIISKR